VLFQSVIAAGLTANLILFAASPIGIAKANGEFRLDSAAVRNNTTIFDGSTVETGVSRSELVLNNGAKVILTPSSRGKVYMDRTLLEKGSTELMGNGSYRIDALSLKVVPDSASSVAQVALNNNNRIVVAAKSGTVNVKNASGVLVAMVMPGNAIEFDPNSATPAISKISGILSKKDGKFLLKDTTTNVTFEAQGTDLDKYVGKAVELTGNAVSGAKPATGATQVLHATSVSPRGSLAKSPKASSGATPGGTAVGGSVAGMSKGMFVTVVGGVAAAATVGGMAASGIIGGNESPASRK
jgi:hypothetical protein